MFIHGDVADLSSSCRVSLSGLNLDRLPPHIDSSCLDHIGSAFFFQAVVYPAQIVLGWITLVQPSSFRLQFILHRQFLVGTHWFSLLLSSCSLSCIDSSWLDHTVAFFQAVVYPKIINSLTSPQLYLIFLLASSAGRNQ